MKYETVRRIFPSRFVLEKGKKDKLARCLSDLIYDFPLQKQIEILKTLKEIFQWPFKTIYNFKEFFEEIVKVFKEKEIKIQINASVCQFEPFDQVAIFKYLKHLEGLFKKQRIKLSSKILIADVIEWYDRKEEWKKWGERRFNLYKKLRKFFDLKNCQIVLLSSFLKEERFLQIKKKVISNLLKVYRNRFLLKTPEIFSIAPKKFATTPYSHQYSVMETIIVLYLFEQGYKIRLGHKGMRKIDEFIKKFFRENFNQKYIAFHIDGGRTLGGDWATPYFIENPKERILFPDSKKEIEEKLKISSKEFKKWLKKLNFEKVDDVWKINEKLNLKKL